MKRSICFWLRTAAVLAVFAAAAPAAFAEERTAIDEVSLTVESDITAGSSSGDVSAESDNPDLYDISCVEVLNAGKTWSEGDRPRVKITLETTDAEAYYFASGSADMFRFSDPGADYVTSVREDAGASITVTVKLSAVEEGDASDEEDDSYDEDDADDADASYGSKSDWLNGTGVYETEDKTGGSGDDEDEKDTEDDEAAEDGGPGTSGSPVVAAASSDDGPGSGADSSYSSASATAGSSARSGSASDVWDSPQTGSGWVKDGTGWWYRNADGSWPEGSWLKLADSWYCFDASGYLRYGWVESSGAWYYCGEDGAMLVNAKTPDGYYVGGDGAWIR